MNDRENEKEEIKVSVSAITYNQANYVRKMVESVLKQKVDFKYEFLISDDASYDGTIEILKEYQKKYPSIITLNIQKENVGATKNSYHNYKKARGKYIASIEGDDYWIDHNKLRRQVEFLEMNPDFSAIQDRCLVVDETGCEIDENTIEESKRFWEFKKGEFELKDYEEWKLPGQNSGLMYRNIFKNNKCEIVWKLDPMVGDRTIALLLLKKGRIRCSDKVGIAYRYVTRENQINYVSTQYSKNKRFEEYRMMAILEKYADRVLGIKLDLSLPRKNKLVGTVCVWLNDRKKDNGEVLKQILLYDKHISEKLVTVIEVIFWNVRCKITGKKERFPI